MEVFICQKNIENFSALLQTEGTSDRRRMLLKLLAAEKAKLAELSRRNPLTGRWKNE